MSFLGWVFMWYIVGVISQTLAVLIDLFAGRGLQFKDIPGIFLYGLLGPIVTLTLIIWIFEKIRTKTEDFKSLRKVMNAQIVKERK